jgi:alkaline phosphatase
MNAATTLGDSLTGRPVPTILELAEKAGYATGLISTAYIQHATPAAFYSHKAHRDWYELIANDLPGTGIEVLMGGGRQYMTPRNTVDEEGVVSQRTDTRNIIDEMKRKGYAYIFDTNGFRSLDTKNTEKVLGLFNAGHMEYELHRAKDKAGEPALWEMTEKALEILSRNRNGFFLMVEAAKIDHAAHGHLTAEYLWEGIACDKTVGVAAEFARKNKDTLLIVVPDHSTGGPYMVGMYDLSKPDSTIIDDGFPHYRLNGAGFPVDDGGRPVAIQWVKGTGHTGEEVTVSAFGPNSGELDGLIQNIDVFRVMARHLGVGKGNKKQRRDASEIIDF